MVELSDEIKDLNNSLAYNVLEELNKDGLICTSDMDLFKHKYEKLHIFVLQTYEHEKNYLAQARQFTHQLMGEKIRLEKTQLEQQEDQDVIQQLSEQLADIRNQQELVSERHMMLQIQLSELDHEKREKVSQLKEREEERQAEAEPQIQKARDEIDSLQKEIELMRSQKELYQAKNDEYIPRCHTLDGDIESSKELLKGFEEELQKVMDDPVRIRKQAEKFENAVKSLTETQREKQAEMVAATETLQRHTVLQKEQEELRSKAQLRLQMAIETSKITEQSCDDVKRRLDRERNMYVEWVATRVRLDQELDELNSEARLTSVELSQIEKQFEKMKRQYKKVQLAQESVEESLEPLRASARDIVKINKQQEEDMRRQTKHLEDIQAEVDLFIGAYLKQETLEKDKKDEFDEICNRMEDMQKELRTLKIEEQEWSARFKTLASQREKLARDASNAHRLCRETGDELSMKHLEGEDLKKKHQEISQKQKEFCTMYEIVKNERNKYMTQIQKSSQHLSEMKEKLKILQNEVEILRMESAFKDKELQRRRTEAQQHNVIKDNLENEKTKIAAKGANLNEQVEQYVIEIDKLYSIINSIEKEMVILRRKYEQAVETRNFTGIQLIDRNDELCILWEKSNIQEKMLKKGEDSMLQKAEEIRGLKIDLVEVERQLHVVQKKIPQVPQLVAEVVQLREQLASVQKRTSDLSLELENPKSSLRKWQKLKGEDLNGQSLRMKIQDLEERLNDKKETLLEKELILEEVSALSQKLQMQASDGRQGTLDLSQKVNMFQSRIKDVTRKMMATVSELSMYQATAHRLEKERDEVQDKTMEARQRVSNGEPPTETALEEFERMIAQERQRELDRQATVQRKQEDDIMNSNFTRTTADPRVNAYIPENEHGLPKAYGSNAPFKPSVLGSTMRHIRKPNPKMIEI